MLSSIPLLMENSQNCEQLIFLEFPSSFSWLLALASCVTTQKNS